MKWKDHRRLILAATQKHRVPYSTYNGLMKGVIYPDETNSWRKMQGERLESHHNPDPDKIIKLIWQARRNWLNGEENNAGFYLGRALHYIHDGSVGKGFLGLFHDSNENKINEIIINENILFSGINDSKCDPFYIEYLICSIKSQSPEKAIDRATYITASLIKAVFNNQSIPIEAEEEYKKASARRKNLIGYLISKIDSNWFKIEKKWKWFNKD